MTQRKERMTVTVDTHLIATAKRAVKSGRAESLSGWVNDALAAQEAKERHLEAMSRAISAYEAEFGVISEDELLAQTRADATRAVIVRGKKEKRRRKAA